MSPLYWSTRSNSCKSTPPDARERSGNNRDGRQAESRGLHGRFCIVTRIIEGTSPFCRPSLFGEQHRRNFRGSIFVRSGSRKENWGTAPRSGQPGRPGPQALKRQFENPCYGITKRPIGTRLLNTPALSLCREILTWSCAWPRMRPPPPKCRWLRMSAEMYR